MRNQFLAAPGPTGPDTKTTQTPSVSGAGLSVPALVEGIEVVELVDRQQRKLNELRNHIDDLLNDGWAISSRNPLTLQRDFRVCYVLHGMLISDSLT